jgi:hypothetical protein
MFAELFEQPLEVGHLHRHRSAPHPAVVRRRVSKPDEPIAALGLE